MGRILLIKRGKKMSILFCLIFFLGLAVFIVFLVMAILKSDIYLILAFFGFFTMLGSVHFYYNDVGYAYYLYKEIIDTTYKFEEWKNNHPELIEKLEKFIEYKELEEKNGF